MNFADFQTARETILRDRPDVRDCGATNVYAALAGHIPPSSVDPTVKVHRCHLASEWSALFGFAPEISKRSLISCGVRDSLRLLFQHYAAEGAILWLPTDNYPVYGELARTAGLVIREFPTLPSPEWPENAATSGSEILLVTNPLKPLGRWLDDRDVAALSAWLAADSRRRLLLDTVYTFEARFHASTLQLLATNQTILLHSLTKGWLHPRLFGITLAPEADASRLTPVFRDAPPLQANLARARELMGNFSKMPATIARDLTSARERLLAELPASLKTISALDANGYFVPVTGHWRDLLDTHNLLGVPATAFGSTREDITILTTLNLFA